MQPAASKAPKSAASWRAARFAATLVPLAALLFLALYLAAQPLPAGHDSEVHERNTLALDTAWRVAPAEAWPLLRTLELRYPPLAYLARLALLRVLPVVPAIHAASWFAAAAFLFFFWRAARRLASPEAALLAVLVVIANPTWVGAALAANLEIWLLAALAFWMWLLLADLPSRSPAASLALGPVAGLALLSKTVIAPHLAAPVLWTAVDSLRRDRREPRRLLAVWLFLASAGALAIAWYAPMFWKMTGEMTLDILPGTMTHQLPWWYYLDILARDYALTPLAVVLAILAVRARFSSSPPSLPPSTRRVPSSALPLFAALTALAFFFAIGTKRPWYLLGADALLVLAAAPLLDRPGARHIRRVAVAWYALLAFLVWLPDSRPLLAFASLGSARPPAALAVNFQPVERALAPVVTQRLPRPGTTRIAVFDLSGLIGWTEFDQAAISDRPLLALEAPLNESTAHMPRNAELADLVLTVLAGDDFARDPHRVFDVQDEAVAASVRDILAADFHPTWRIPLRSAHLLAYVRNGYDPPPPLSPRDAVDAYFLANPSRAVVYLRRTRALLDAGRTADALRRYRLTLDLLPDENPALAGLADALARTGDRAAEAAELSRRLLASDLQPPIVAKYLDRLRRIDAAAFASLADALLTRLPPGDTRRDWVVAAILADRAARGEWIGLAPWLLAEVDRHEPAARTDVLARFADRARSFAEPSVADALFAALLARPDLTPARRVTAVLERAALTPAPTVPDLAPADVTDAAQAELLTSLCLDGASSAWLCDPSAPWLDLCPVCADKLNLAAARRAIAAGDRDAALAALARIAHDPDIKRIAAGLRGRLD